MDCHGDLTAEADRAAGSPTRPSRVASPSEEMGPLLRLDGRPALRGDATARELPPAADAPTHAH